MRAPASISDAGAFHCGIPRAMPDASSLAADSPAARPDPSVSVRMVYLARLREAFATAGEPLTLAAGVAPTVESILAALRSRGGVFASELAPGRAFRVAVNHVMVDASAPVGDGDEVAVFPPVTGG